MSADAFSPLSSKRAAWQAAGVRHAVLLRILPVLSHDLATPIAVLRMSAMVLRRKRAIEPVLDAGDCDERITVVEQQTEALARTLKLLAGWDSGAPVDASAVSRPELVDGCVRLLQPLLRMRGIRLDAEAALRLGQQEREPDAAPEAAGQPQASSLRRWPGASSLRYLLLASIFHLHDARPHLERIDIRPDGEDALRLVASSIQPSAQPPRARDAFERESVPRLDASALECLADDLGYPLRLAPDGVWFQLKAH